MPRHRGQTMIEKWKSPISFINHWSSWLKIWSCVSDGCIWNVNSLLVQDFVRKWWYDNNNDGDDEWWWWWIFTEECSWPMQALAASAISSQIWSLWRPSSNNSFSHDLIYYLNSMFGVIWSPWLPTSNIPPSSWPISQSAYFEQYTCHTRLKGPIWFSLSYHIWYSQTIRKCPLVGQNWFHSC